MAPSLRRLLPAAAFAVAAGVVLAWQGLIGPDFTDYQLEAEPAIDALRAGDLGGFLARLPAYGGSLILRAPFVLAGELAGGGATAAFRLAALPCLLAAAAFGVALFARQARPVDAWLTLVVATANPVTLRALEVGHPEELLGGVLCAAAVLVALRGRPGWAGVLLGLAIGNKAWGVLAVGPVLVALQGPAARRAALAAAGAVAAVLVVPGLLAAPYAAATPTGTTGAIFQPWQAWWFLGDPDVVVRDMVGGVKEGYRGAPAWLSPIPRPLIVLLAVPLTVMVALRPRRAPADALLLLALLLFLRCLLDPWNTTYYVLPAILALLAWEAVDGRPPFGALMLTALTMVTTDVLVTRVSPDVQAAAYLAWAAPVAGLLALRLFAPRRAHALGGRLRTAAERHAPSLARLLSPPSSAPSAGR